MRVSAGNSMKLNQKPCEPTLYSADREHDACGVGFVANIRNKKDHAIIQDGLQILLHLEHRGATGADPKAGDGAGILIQTPHRFTTKLAQTAGCQLPDQGAYAIGHIFMPPKNETQKKLEALIENTLAAHGQQVLFWRDVPVDDRCLGEAVKAAAPVHRQIVIARGSSTVNADDFERKLLAIRRLIEKTAREINDPEINEFFYIPLCRRARSFIKACSSPTRSSLITATSPIPILKVRSHSFISAFQQTRSVMAARTPLSHDRP